MNKQLPEWYLNLLAMHSFVTRYDGGDTWDVYCDKCGHRAHSTLHPDDSEWAREAWGPAVASRRLTHIEEDGCKP